MADESPSTPSLAVGGEEQTSANYRRWTEAEQRIGWFYITNEFMTSEDIGVAIEKSATRWSFCPGIQIETIAKKQSVT